jgi:hypothetical protein
MDEIEQAMKVYLDTKMITISRQTGVFLADNNKWSIYVQDPETRLLVEAEPEDIRSFEQSRQLDKFRIDPKRFSKTVGFINLFKTGKEMVFRLKDVQQKQNNTGTRIDSLIKGDIMRRFNDILGQPMYTDTDPVAKGIFQPGFCAMVEIVLRQWSAEEKEGKIWFLNPEEAMYSGITKYQAKN